MNNSPPLWVTTLVNRVCTDRGIRRRPIIVWQSKKAIPPHLTIDTNRNEELSYGGYTFKRKDLSGGEAEIDGSREIRIYYGSLNIDRKSVLLHELAHWISKEDHTKAFWDLVWVLYRTYMPRSLEYLLHSEGTYRVESVQAAIRAGIPGAEEVLPWSREFIKSHSLKTKKASPPPQTTTSHR